MNVCTSLLFQLLGWKLSDEKLVPYNTCCKVLGIERVLTHRHTALPDSSAWPIQTHGGKN